MARTVPTPLTRAAHTQGRGAKSQEEAEDESTAKLRVSELKTLHKWNEFQNKGNWNRKGKMTKI